MRIDMIIVIDVGETFKKFRIRGPSTMTFMGLAFVGSRAAALILGRPEPGDMWLVWRT
jgi:hypothetical protein